MDDADKSKMCMQPQGNTSAIDPLHVTPTDTCKVTVKKVSLGKSAIIISAQLSGSKS